MTSPAPGLDRAVDLHVAFGPTGVPAVAARATARGLRTVGIAGRLNGPHEEFDAYVAAVRSADAVSGVRLLCAPRVVLAHRPGGSDLPPEVYRRLSRVDRLVLVPGPPRPGSPARGLEDMLMGILRAAMTSPVPVVLAPPPLAVSPDARGVPEATLRELGRALAGSGISVEVCERDRSPSIRVALLLASTGVRLVAGSGARAVPEIGRWQHVAAVAGALDTLGTELARRTGTAPERDPAAHPAARRVLPVSTSNGGDQS